MDPDSIALMRLVDAKKHAEIEVAARRMLDKHPRHTLALKALGFALIGAGRHEDALPVIEFALGLSPGDPELHNNHGISLSMMMRWDEALGALGRSLEIEPDNPETLKNLGVAYSRMHRWEDAVSPLLRAIECHPGDYVEAVSTLADVLLMANRVDEAWTCFSELWKANQDDLGALAQLISVNLRRCDWSDLSKNLVELRERTHGFSSLSCSPLGSLAWPGATGAEHAVIAANFAAAQIPESFLRTEPLSRCHALVSDARPLKIGYMSGDFRNHPVGQVVVEVFERHQRNRVEVTGYSLAGSDGSPLRARIENSFDRFIDLGKVNVFETAQRIRQDGIQILVDLSGWTSDGRPESLALRCAPVQVNWLGFPGTIGHPKLADYVIGDGCVTPLGEAAFFTETIASMPYCYFPLDTSSRPSAKPSRAQAGLPETGFIFCSFNNSYKYNPEVFDLWCRILAETPGSFLWLSQPARTAMDNLKREANARGIDAGRLLFAGRVEGRAEHLARLQWADLALDPFPYNSHSTAADALLAGVPMISLVGSTFAGRVGASLLRAASLDELAVVSPQAYFEAATALYRAPDRLKTYRDRLAHRQALALFDLPRFTAALEDLYSRMWQDHCAGIRRPIILG